MTATLAVSGILISVAALAVSVSSALVSRRQLRVAERHRAREFGAAVVAELILRDPGVDAIEYTLRVTNAGPAVARDVDVSLVEWSDAGPLGRTLCQAKVAPALVRGEHRVVVLALPVADARFDDRSLAIELGADYYDDEGVRNERLALLLDDTLIHLPPRTPAG